jgi:FixJ family two-component response regulator
VKELEQSVKERAKKRTVIGARLSLLSPRERAVLEFVVAGKSNKVAAKQLSLSSKTIEMHRAHVMKKLHISSLAELVRLVVSSESDAE